MLGSTGGGAGCLLATTGLTGRLAELTGFGGIGSGLDRVEVAGRCGNFAGCANRRGVFESFLGRSSSAFRLVEALCGRWMAGAGLSEDFPPLIWARRSPIW